MQGTRPSSRTAIARSITRTCGGELEVALGQPQAALLHDPDVALLHAEHVEVVAERPAGVQLAACLRHLGRRSPRRRSSALIVDALDEVEHERAELGQVGDDARADAGLGGRQRVLVLVVAVDREQPGVLGRHAHHVAAPADDDLVVRVREPAGQLGDDAVAPASCSTRGRMSSIVTCSSLTGVLPAGALAAKDTRIGRLDR